VLAARSTQLQCLGDGADVQRFDILPTGSRLDDVVRRREDLVPFTGFDDMPSTLLPTAYGCSVFCVIEFRF